MDLLSAFRIETTSGSVAFFCVLRSFFGENSRCCALACVVAAFFEPLVDPAKSAAFLEVVDGGVVVVGGAAKLKEIFINEF